MRLTEQGDALPDKATTLARLGAWLATPIARGILVVLGLASAYLASFDSSDQMWPPYRIDLDVYRIGGAALLSATPLYGPLPATEIGASLPFTYPPFAALLFAPLAMVPMRVANLIFVLGTWVAMWLALRFSVREVAPNQQNWLTPLAFGVAFTLEPVIETLNFGQINVFLMALVILDVLAGRGRSWRGVLIGVAVAIKLTPAVFLAYFLVRRDWRGLANAIGSILGCTLIGFAVAPRDSITYWTTALLDPSRIGQLDYVANQSINGFLARGLGEDGRTLVWFLSCAVIGLVVLKLTYDVVRAGQDFAALLIFACYVLLASPVSWSHHWVWAAPILVLLGVWGWQQRSGWLLAVALVGLVAFTTLIIWRLPGESELGLLSWTWWQHLPGNAYSLWALAVIGSLWWFGRRASVASQAAARA